MANLKIGIGHELVIVARKPGSAPKPNGRTVSAEGICTPEFGHA